jgi:hypothetical protein
MLHSDIVPEHPCNGELIQPDQAPSYVHFALCASYGTEFTHAPDSDWVSIALPGMKRKLVFAKTGSFTGWQCRACGWRSQTSQFSVGDNNPPDDVVEAFEKLPAHVRRNVDFASAFSEVAARRIGWQHFKFTSNSLTTLQPFAHAFYRSMPPLPQQFPYLVRRTDRFDHSLRVDCHR